MNFGDIQFGIKIQQSCVEKENAQQILNLSVWRFPSLVVKKYVGGNIFCVKGRMTLSIAVCCNVFICRNISYSCE